MCGRCCRLVARSWPPATRCVSQPVRIFTNECTRLVLSQCWLDPHLVKRFSRPNAIHALLSFPLPSEAGQPSPSSSHQPSSLDLERIVAEWRPDLIVHECTDLAAPIAAAAAGVPAISQGWGLVPLPGQTVCDPADVEYLWRSRGLEVDPYAGIFGAVHLHPMPASLEPDAKVPVGYLQPMRLDTQQLVGAALPDWADRLDPTRRPVIYVSLGTHPYFSQPDFFRIILDGLAKFDADVVATLGAHNDPQSLGPQPDNVHLERWLPLPLLLPRCSLVVCHGGSGTLLASLAAGLPLLLLPRGADQFGNAAACASAGVARSLAPEALTSEAVADAVQHLLVDDSYRRAGARLRAELEAMPAPTAVVPLLEQLALGKSPSCLATFG